jgi:hypothetical protein
MNVEFMKFIGAVFLLILLMKNEIKHNNQTE